VKFDAGAKVMVTLSKSRIEALSDGVFSIAMTLLVLKLEVPEVMHHASNDQMLQQIVQFAAGVCYLCCDVSDSWRILVSAPPDVSFHPACRFVSGVGQPDVSDAGGAAAVFAGLMNHFAIHPVSQLFYFGNQLAIAVLLNVHWRYAKRRRMLIDSEERDSARLSYRVGHTVVIFAACMVVAALFPTYSWVLFGSVLGAGLIIEWVTWRKR